MYVSLLGSVELSELCGRLQPSLNGVKSPRARIKFPRLNGLFRTWNIYCSVHKSSQIGAVSELLPRRFLVCLTFHFGCSKT